MDSKPKTKLVCVGWGIWDFGENCLWLNPVGRIRWWTRKDAIEAWDYLYGKNNYEGCRQSGWVIAKKLWVEVK